MDVERFRGITAAKRANLISSTDTVLLLLSNNHGVGWRQGDLAKALGVGLSTISMAKEALYKRGLIYETQPLRDTRGVTVYLTDEGRDLADTKWAAIQSLAKLEVVVRNQRPD